MKTKTNLTPNQIVEAIEEITRQWMLRQRDERGDAFATEEEMQSLLSDPQGWLVMLRGVDAYALFNSVLR